jgi:hypothetical protein
LLSIVKSLPAVSTIEQRIAVSIFDSVLTIGSVRN